MVLKENYLVIGEWDVSVEEISQWWVAARGLQWKERIEDDVGNKEFYGRRPNDQ